MKNVVIVRKPVNPYQTIRNPQGELEASSTISEEELVVILKEQGVTAQSLSGRLRI